MFVSVAGLCHTPFSSVRWYDPGNAVIAAPSLTSNSITRQLQQGSTAAKRTAPGSLSHSTAELARAQPPRGDPFLSAHVVSSSSFGI
ncbi:hypothetical protein EPR50_G00112350 [Perca flavescens]|uniref:Uncharacterized protein n=1 Tax=Perca flavescens TaxID=8167 RepID=A0A484CZA7_PERFV|nr:hypothetical protein EPR50_G00112350 [Perca flavescens]